MCAPPTQTLHGTSQQSLPDATQAAGAAAAATAVPGMNLLLLAVEASTGMQDA